MKERVFFSEGERDREGEGGRETAREGEREREGEKGGEREGERGREGEREMGRGREGEREKTMDRRGRDGTKIIVYKLSIPPLPAYLHIPLPPPWVLPSSDAGHTCCQPT